MICIDRTTCQLEDCNILFLVPRQKHEVRDGQLLDRKSQFTASQPWRRSLSLPIPRVAENTAIRGLLASAAVMSRRPAWALLSAANNRADDHEWTVIALEAVQYRRSHASVGYTALGSREREHPPTRDCFRRCVHRLRGPGLSSIDLARFLNHRLWMYVVYYTLLLLVGGCRLVSYCSQHRGTLRTYVLAK